MSVCAVICGADFGGEVAVFCDAQQEWWAQKLDLPYGFPSRDTYCRVCAPLDAQAFEDCFLQWVQEQTLGQVIAIDGKSERRSPGVLGAQTRQHGPLHCVIAWATANRRVRVQPAVGTKSHGIMAISAPLQRLALSGGIVTMDRVPFGWVCQQSFARQAMDQKAD